MAENEQLNFISSPHAHDVLSGRGNLVNRHRGNVNFRYLVKRYKEEYVACPKSHKSMYSELIYDEIRSLDPAGRFLKQDPNTKLWSDIGKKMALAKIRQALREGAPELLRDLQTAEQSRLNASSSSENKFARADNVRNNAVDNSTSIETCNETKKSLSRFLPRSSSIESTGAESLLSLCSMNMGKKNDASQFFGTAHNQVMSGYGVVPLYNTWIGSTSQSGEPIVTRRADRAANQVQITDQPADQWQHISNIQNMIAYSSTQAPGLQLHVEPFNVANTGVNQQLKFPGGTESHSTNRFTTISGVENAPFANFAAASHQQQHIVGNNVSQYYDDASINKFTYRCGINNDSFVNSATSSRQHPLTSRYDIHNAAFVNSAESYRQQCTTNNERSGNIDDFTYQFASNGGIEGAAFVNSNESNHQQHFDNMSNASGTDNTASLMSLLSILNSNVSQANTQLSQSQSVYQQQPHLDVRQNVASQEKNQCGDTQMQNVRAKSA